MASELRYGEGGLKFPHTDDYLSTLKEGRAVIERSWDESRRPVADWKFETEAPSTQPSKWTPRDPPPSPHINTQDEELPQESWRTRYQQRDFQEFHEVHDGWLPEPQDLNQIPRSAKAPIPEGHIPGNATLTYSKENGELVSIPGLNLSLIEERSLLLAAAFEGSQSGQRLYLETLSELTAMPLLRYLYTGSYAEFDFWEDVPTSLLLHCKMFQLGVIYDIDELEKQAKFNIRRQCEFGCSSPDRPIDLCRAIRFAYNELKDHDGAVSEIIHYCISRFLDHNLGEDADFKQLAYDLRPFHQDLVKTCKDRGYADESAAAIISMPYKPYRPDTYASTETPAIAKFEDLVFHFHGSDDYEGSSTKRARLSQMGMTPDYPVLDKGKQKFGDPPCPKSALTLALRQAAKSQSEPEAQNTTTLTKEETVLLCVTTPNNEKSVLPIRSRPVSKVAATRKPYIEDTSASEDETMLIVRKRKHPYYQTKPEEAIFSGSESDFELVSGPDAVLSASSDNSDDSDTATLVEAPISSGATSTARSVPHGHSSQPFATGQDNADDTLSEWEWEDVM